MTVGEAIKRIENHIEVHSRKEKHFAFYITEALNMAVDALRKQAPKKPLKKNPICYAKTKDGQESYVYDYHCPVCGTKLKVKEHHCPCGQTLDWEEYQ